MYLSRVEIDTLNRRKVSKLTHLGAYHDWVEKSFPMEIAAGIRSRHLWRIDQLKGKSYLLVLSADKPDLSELTKYGVVGTAETKDYDQFLGKLTKDGIYRFRLTANPTYRSTRNEDGKSIVFPHVTIEQQKTWLLKKVQGAGFSLDQDDFDIVNREFVILYKNHRRVKLSRVTFEGVLRIVDLEKFKDTLIKGLGREKSYGMGLLTVIPVK